MKSFKIFGDLVIMISKVIVIPNILNFSKVIVSNQVVLASQIHLHKLRISPLIFLKVFLFLSVELF